MIRIATTVAQVADLFEPHLNRKEAYRQLVAAFDNCFEELTSSWMRDHHAMRNAAVSATALNRTSRVREAARTRQEHARQTEGWEKKLRAFASERESGPDTASPKDIIERSTLDILRVTLKVNQDAAESFSRVDAALDYADEVGTQIESRTLRRGLGKARRLFLAWRLKHWSLRHLWVVPYLLAIGLAFVFAQLPFLVAQMPRLRAAFPLLVAPLPRLQPAFMWVGASLSLVLGAIVKKYVSSATTDLVDRRIEDLTKRQLLQVQNEFVALEVLLAVHQTAARAKAALKG